MRTAIPALALTLLLAAGCTTQPLGGISASTDQALYSPGQPVPVTIVNNSSVDVRYSACPERWDRKTATGYVRIEKLESCPMIVTIVPAGGSAEATYSLPEGQPLGTWRIAIQVSPAGTPGSTEVYTPDFQMVVFSASRSDPALSNPIASGLQPSQ